MCNQEKYINIQTGEELDWNKVFKLPDNLMLKVKPELWTEWDFEKNTELGLDIYGVTKGMNKKAWWICPKCVSNYDIFIHSRASANQNCPYCASKRINHTNSLATKNPEIASLLLNKEDAHKYALTSNKKVDWKCKCGQIIRNKSVYAISNRGLSCPRCSDGISYPEKLVNAILNEISVKFTKEKMFKWSNTRKYDFYLPTLNMIIEVHGRQHYDVGFNTLGGVTPEEQQLIDQYKYEMAIGNGIKPENYIVIDARYSDFEYIKNSILQSKINELFDFSNVNWKKCNRYASDSNVKKSAEYYNEGKSPIEISKLLNVKLQTAIRYLTRARESDLCLYTPKIIVKRKRKICRLNDDYKIIDVFDGAFEASIKSGIHQGSISRSCHNKGFIKAGGYRWLFKEDYDNTAVIDEETFKKYTIVQLDLSGNLIKKWTKMSEASRETKVFDGSICMCCKGKLKKSGGYKWMYIEDYYKYIEEQSKLA